MTEAVAVHDIDHGVRLHVHEDAEPWFSADDAVQLRTWLSWLWEKMPAVDVHLFHRREVHDVYREWYAEPYDLPPGIAHYAFRGWMDDAPDPIRVVMFADETETKSSLMWLMLHEFTHAAVAHAKYLQWYFCYLRDDAGIDADANPAEASDEDHERHPEEQFCNAVATRLMEGEDYNRLWWRERVNLALRKGADERRRVAA